MKKIFKKALSALLISTTIFQGSTLKGNGFEALCGNAITGVGKLMGEFPEVTKIFGVIGFATVINKLTSISFAQMIGAGALIATIADPFVGAGAVLAAGANIVSRYVPVGSMMKSASDMYNKVCNFPLFGKQKKNEQFVDKIKNKSDKKLQLAWNKTTDKITVVKPEVKSEVKSVIAEQVELDQVFKKVSDNNVSANQVFDIAYNKILNNNSLNKEREQKERKQVERRLTIIGGHLVK